MDVGAGGDAFEQGLAVVVEKQIPSGMTTRKAWLYLFSRARWPMSRRSCMPGKVTVSVAA